VKVRYLLAATALVLGTTPVLAADSDKNQDQKTEQKQKLICRTNTTTGSLTRKTRICKTADEWRESNQKTREAIDSFTRDAASPQQAANPLGG
jgi:hypothetical protein